MDLSKKMNNSTKALDYLRALMPTILGSLIPDAIAMLEDPEGNWVELLETSN